MLAAPTQEDPGLAERDQDRTRFSVLLAVLLTNLLVTPFLPEAAFDLPVSRLLFSATLVAAVYAASRRLRAFAIAAVLAAPAIVADWFSLYTDTLTVDYVYMTLGGLSLTLVAVVILNTILRENQVRLDTIFGGICVFLLIGVVWSVVYAAVELALPGSFSQGGVSITEINKGTLDVSRHHQLRYFSFVTLTTLGFGDIVPATNQARALAAGEAILGQLYVAIFIARLVGLYVAQGLRADP